ncbi:hypothetical protein LEP1GSC048_2560 [Leptospira santarosai serovar Shermani str. 1342KT]|nr:hypothetical protein LEP1GSC048_2560 [Leptospira santarosai serovar Shermani str. 1342KT]
MTEAERSGGLNGNFFNSNDSHPAIRAFFSIGFFFPIFF